MLIGGRQSSLTRFGSQRELDSVFAANATIPHHTGRLREPISRYRVTQTLNMYTRLLFG